MNEADWASWPDWVGEPQSLAGQTYITWLTCTGLGELICQWVRPGWGIAINGSMCNKSGVAFASEDTGIKFIILLN